jgi:single-strand DNA-binding protein
MATRSLNKVQLIGNLTRDPELRYTPSGAAVCNFGMATNRSWTTDAGEEKEKAEFHRIVSWNKLAELCAQFLFKGRKVFVEGRLQTRQWTGQDGAQREITEIVISNMLILDSRRSREGGVGEAGDEEQAADKAPSGKKGDKKRGGKARKATSGSKVKSKGQVKKKAASSSSKKTPKDSDQKEVNAEDIPF